MTKQEFEKLIDSEVSFEDYRSLASNVALVLFKPYREYMIDCLKSLENRINRTEKEVISLKDEITSMRSITEEDIDRMGKIANQIFQRATDDTSQED